MKPDIILASASKRRSEILTSCGIKHRVYVSNVSEIHNKARGVVWNVVQNAKRKALFSAKIYKSNIIIGADTLVSLGNDLIGKPKNSFHAKKLLKDFSGKKIEVTTGLFVVDTATGKFSPASKKSTLYVRELSPVDIDGYFKALKPYDKAGGFSIEGVGSIIFDNIRGSYFNILGLPMGTLSDLFKKIDKNILKFI